MKRDCDIHHDRRWSRKPHLCGAIACGLLGALLSGFSHPVQAEECAFVGNQLVGTLRILAIPDGEERSATALPGCDVGLCQLTDIAVRPASSAVYVTQFDGSRVWVIDYTDPESPPEPTSIPLANTPTDLVLSPDGSRLYVISWAAQAIVTIDPSVNEEIGRFDAPSQPRGLAISPDGSKLVVTSRNQNRVFILDSATGATVEMGDVGERPLTVALSPSGDRAYVSSEGGTLAVVDMASGDTIDTFTVGQLPYAIVVTGDGGTVFVANYGSNTVSAVDLAEENVTTIGVGQSPVALALTAEGLLLVANQQGESLSVIDTQNENAVLAPIPAGVSPSALTVGQCADRPLATPTDTPVASPINTPTNTPTGPDTCVGDCNGDVRVAINELIIGVNIALGQTEVIYCTAFDADGSGSIEISELVRGVGNSLNGCPA